MPALLAFVVGGLGLVLGGAGLSPAAWPLVWIGFALMAFGLALPTTRSRALLGLALCVCLTRALWFSWSFSMAEAMVPDASSLQLQVGLGFLAVVTLPTLVVIAAGAVAFHGRVRFWLPVAWVIGEHVQVAWTSISSEWLFTQVDVAPVMGAVARFGGLPAALVCLFVAASAGEALAHRRGAWFVPAALVLVALGSVPPPPHGDPSALAGVGVVHLRSSLEVPAVDEVDGGSSPRATPTPRAVSSPGPRRAARQ